MGYGLQTIAKKSCSFVQFFSVPNDVAKIPAGKGTVRKSSQLLSLRCLQIIKMFLVWLRGGTSF